MEKLKETEESFKDINSQITHLKSEISQITHSISHSIQRPFFEGCFSMLFDAHSQRSVLLRLLSTSAYYLNAFETEERIGCTTRVAE